MLPASGDTKTWSTTRLATCPEWCVVAHGEHGGEEDWLHLSEPIRLVKHVEARLAATVGPEGQGDGGPSLLIGSESFTPAEASALGSAITSVAEAAKVLAVTPSGA